ncbi:polysaccharide deacetylase family protein [Streptantibioticus rubrisoli]|uniref:Polysaccharide deacetylase family protein n=1 Tax=Streptantibioticus rubrisoli TaxID=1387313 RepID=A0ABT1PK86_9ACTN|nr:polysaccharide deacetylase family protein [Streptantibioticus rubrisoli]MCQ4045777.1 polysaccharide deacetylase family protein [Streptantibioticus rubrisoli]
MSAAGAGDGTLPAPEHHVAGGPKTLALTFGNVPNPLYTPGVLAVLARYHVPVTFFVLGANAAKYPDTVRRVADEGHVLGNHTCNHPNLGHLSTPRIRGEIERTQQFVTEITGRAPVLFRVPGG